MDQTTSVKTKDSLKEYKKKAINLLLKNNILLKPEYLKKYNQLGSSNEVISYTNELLQEHNAQPQEIKKEGEGNLQIIDTYKEHIKKREISDFVMHYNNRFKALSSILKQRDIQNLTSVNIIKGMKDKDTVSTIGMIYDISESKNGHIVLSLEDKTGIIKAIVMKTNQELFQFAKNLALDEVVAVTGTAGKDVIFVSEIIFPDIPVTHELKKSDKEEYVVFIGDLHIGSHVFYKEEFSEFIKWISGTKVPAAHKDIVKKIKYLVIPGDVIEGVGIFPGQEDELEYRDVIQQYNAFAEYVEKIPEHIQIVICPGNHDAVRIAEPQPPFHKKFLGKLADFPNVKFISSPGTINIGKTEAFEGFNILMYHGFSMPYYGDKIPEIRESGGLSNMGAIMKFYLQRRHFAPAHGSTQFVPDIRYDPLVISKVPDILVTGHVHKISVDTYRGVTMINASTWVAPSEYQARFGLVPDCCRAIVMNLKTREVKILNFEKEAGDEGSK
jgi:DNA polymerase II small subunit